MIPAILTHPVFWGALALLAVGVALLWRRPHPQSMNAREVQHQAAVTAYDDLLERATNILARAEREGRPMTRHENLLYESLMARARALRQEGRG